MIKIQDRYIDELNDYGLLTLVGIMLNATDDNKNLGKAGLITQKQIAYELQKPEDKSIQRAITIGLNNLIENNLISVYDRYHYLVDYKRLCLKDGFYTLIKKSEISKIMNYDSHDKKSGLLRYAVTLFSSFNKTKKIGFMSQSYISNNIKKSLTTIQKYNAILVDLDIIGIIKATNYIDKEGTVSRTTNIYYRPEDYGSAVAYFKSRTQFVKNTRSSDGVDINKEETH